jgi:Outer membrane protein beta-barrel domain
MKYRLSFFLVSAFLMNSVALSQPRFGLTGTINISSVVPLQNNANNAAPQAESPWAYTAFNFQNDLAVTTFSAGLVAEFKLSKLFKIRSELLYFQKGWEHYLYDNTKGSYYVFQNYYKINYLEIPVRIDYGTPVGAGRAYIGIGPSLSYGLSGTQHSVYTPIPGSTVKPYDTSYSVKLGSDSGDFKRIQIGLNAVIGYEFRFGLFLQISYDLGFNGIVSSANSGSRQNFSIFQFGLGYMLNTWPKSRKPQPNP